MKMIPCLRALALAVLCAVSVRAADKELNLFAWSEYVPQGVLDAFTAETGIKVNYETFASGEEMLAKLIAGGTAYDLIQPPDYIAEALIKNKLLVPINFARVPNFRHILAEYKGMPHDPEQMFTVPYMTGTVGIVVNTDRIKTPIRGIKDLFAPANKGRIVVVDDGRELVTAALYVLGRSLNDITPETLAQARPLLAEWFQAIKLFDSDSPKTALLNGDVDLGYVWGGEAATLWNEDKKFKYVLPSEGAHMFVDVLAIPVGAKNLDSAHAFIDFVLRPEISKQISDEFPYTNPNGEARKLLSDEQRANPASYPPTQKLDTFRHLGETGALIDELVTDLKNAR
ncbi:MAG TPA: spermidine/putrescine ABC transporter substrate-binding protein [Opitutaceae bacterium]